MKKIASTQDLIEALSNLELKPNTSIFSQLEKDFADRIGFRIQYLIRSNYSHNHILSLEYAALGSILGVSSSEIFGQSTPFNKVQAIELLNKISI